MISKINKTVNDEYKKAKAKRHDYSKDPDIEMAFYRIMKFADKNFENNQRYNNFIVRGCFNIMFLLLSQEYQNVGFIQRIFRELYKTLRYKFRFFRDL